MAVLSGLSVYTIFPGSVVVVVVVVVQTFPLAIIIRKMYIPNA